jgi:hypothetical protein
MQLTLMMMMMMMMMMVMICTTYSSGLTGIWKESDDPVLP